MLRANRSQTFPTSGHMLHSSSENHRHATAGDALASDLKRVESLCKLPHTVIDGWNIECGDRATAEATFGVSTVTTNELFVENAWSHLCSEGLRMKLANFQITERTTMNSMMSTVAYWDPPVFDFQDTRYNETLPRMGKNITYIVGRYVSANQRILKVLVVAPMEREGLRTCVGWVPICGWVHLCWLGRPVLLGASLLGGA